MKIKTKKQLTLPQLIEWVRGNGIKNKRFIHLDSNPPEYVWINENSNVELDEDMCISKTDTFAVEVEEEVTEDTVIPKMLEMSFDAYQNVVLDIQVNHSINMVKENAKVLTLHIINDDDTHTLIWRDGKMVE